PEIFKQNLTLKGAVIGISVGVPSGIVVLYVIFALAGML
ncbi:unnamed protein product, partial [marine sediment metagenome]